MEFDTNVKDILGVVTGIAGVPENSAYNIRLDSATSARKSSEHIQIQPRADGRPGIDIIIAPGTVGETVYIPAVVSQSGIHDLVYNDFIVGEGADVTIVAGCGVCADGCDEALHEGIHSFAVGKNARVKYVEKHIGVGDGTGQRVINPKTYAVVQPGGTLEMETTQIKGVDSTSRFCKARLLEDAHITIKEKIMTHGTQTAETAFEVDLDGVGSSAELSSRSVAREQSKQTFLSKMRGNTECAAHSECDAIIMDQGTVTAVPEIQANCLDASLIHEAAIGKIAGEQLIKLMTLGLTEKQAEEKIIAGFLS